MEKVFSVSPLSAFSALKSHSLWSHVENNRDTGGGLNAVVLNYFRCVLPTRWVGFKSWEKWHQPAAVNSDRVCRKYWKLVISFSCISQRAGERRTRSAPSHRKAPLVRRLATRPAQQSHPDWTFTVRTTTLSFSPFLFVTDNLSRFSLDSCTASVTQSLSYFLVKLCVLQHRCTRSHFSQQVHNKPYIQAVKHLEVGLSIGLHINVTIIWTIIMITINERLF